MRESHDIARENLKSSVTLNKRDYDLRKFQCCYEVGDFVYVLDPSYQPGLSKKLQPIFKGPYLVVKVLNALLYKLRGRKNEIVVHHNRLQACEDRFIPLWMRRLRQEFLNLDETIAYDESELEDLNYYTADLSRDEGIELENKFSDPVESIELLFKDESTNTIPNPTTDTQHVSGSSTSQSDSGDSEEDISSAPGQDLISRRGRKIKMPQKFRDYVLDNDDETAVS